MSSHSYSIRARDAAGNTSAPSLALFVDTDAPSPPVLAVPIASGMNGMNVSLSWSTVSDADHYQVFRGATQLASPTATTYTDTVPAPGLYSYSVNSVDSSDNVSTDSNLQSINIPAAVPLNLSVTTPSPNSSTVNLSWSPVTGATGYVVYRNGSSTATPTSTTYTDTVADGTYSYAVTSTSAGGESAKTDSESVTIDATPPAVPGASATAVISKVTVAWALVPDATQYRVYRDGTLMATVLTSIYEETVADGTYVYRVESGDAVGNWSAKSSPTSVTIDTTPPDVPTVTVTHEGYSFLVSWDPVPDADLYAIRLNGDPVTTTTETSYTGIVPSNGTWYYQVAARDSNELWSAYSPREDVVVEVDTVTLPAPVIRTDSQNYQGLVVWYPLIETDVAAYEIARDGQVIASVRGNVHSFEDDTVRGTGVFTYTVRAKDTEGEYSPWSVPVQQTIIEGSIYTRPSMMREPTTSSNPILPSETIGREPLEETRGLIDYDPLA